MPTRRRDLAGAIPGFANRKPNRSGEYVKLVAKLSSAGKIDESADAQFQTLATAFAQQIGTAAAGVEIDVNKASLPYSSAVSVGASLYARELGLARKMISEGRWESIDLSAIDYRVTRAMGADGWGADDIAVAIEANSPGLGDRTSR